MFKIVIVPIISNYNGDESGLKIFKNDFIGIFKKRPNRFIIIAELNKKEVTCHCPNTGRMGELLLPGVKLILEESQNPERKTKYSVVAVYKGDLVVPITSARANDVAEKVIIPELFNYEHLKREYTYGNSRFDFYLTDSVSKTFIEVKSCTLFNGEVAMFPDAPTTRGVKHMKELFEATKEGYSGVVLLVVFSPNVSEFSPNSVTDPKFASTMKSISDKVQIIPYKIMVNSQGEVLKVENPILPIKYLGE